MDDKGYWHDRRPDAIDEINRELGRSGAVPQPRYVMSMAIGEVIRVEKSGGEMIRARFDEAKGNKITLTPLDDKRPYLETAERVQITNEQNVTVEAQVWDTRGGKIVLRTLPVERI